MRIRMHGGQTAAGPLFVCGPGKEAEVDDATGIAMINAGFAAPVGAAALAAAAPALRRQRAVVRAPETRG